ncbi:MAG TPA: transglutaminase-like domain-containing protein [Bdellovibrionota bacterium]|jgi:regulator of sirC expression with transglutaminase-like and TPR domain|nr:transglutaminase-like domain-containing protein [Bdellovibrionota bacterium]
MLSEDQVPKIIEQIEALLDSVKNPNVDDWDPIRLGLLISKFEYENIDVEKEVALFDALAKEYCREFSPQSTLRTKTETLIRIFSGDLGFAGDRSNYYNLKNSFLYDVLLRRKGIPITLSLAFMGLARRVGLKAVGISFPGHFLVKMVPAPGYLEIRDSNETAEDWRSQWYIDCFDGGKILSTEDCERRLYEWTRGVVPFGPEALDVAHPRDIISRVLRNLKAIVAEKEDWARLYWILSALIGLSEKDRNDAYSERGFLFARIGRFGKASEDLREYLKHARDSGKIAHIEQMLRYFEIQTEVTN